MSTLVPGTRLAVRTFERRDLQAVRHMIYYNYYTHTHLDWQTIDEYLHSDPENLWVAERDQQVVGIMGFSENIGGTCWLRVMGANDTMKPNDILITMWQIISSELRMNGIYTVTVLLLRDWMNAFLDETGFHYVEDIVTLRRHGRQLPEMNGMRPVIKRIELIDMPGVLDVDHAAFPVPWQLSMQEVRLGVRVSTYSTIAMVDDELVGYQISTTHGQNGHLARLAVEPKYQRHGIGSWLVADMLSWFRARDVLAVTVNTQESNIRSQRLYELFGFRRNGYDMAVWMVRLSV